MSAPPASRSIRLAAVRRLGSGATAVGLRGGTLLLSVLAVTLVAPFLGKDELGRYAVLQSITVWAGLVNLGMVEACSGILGKFHHAGARAAGQRYLGTAFRIVSLVAIVLTVLLATGAAASMLAAGTSLQTLAPWLVGAGCALASAPFVLAQAPLNADGAIGRNTAWGFVTSVASVGGVLLVIQAAVVPEHRLLAVVAASGLATLAVRVAMYRVELRRSYGSLRGGTKVSLRRAQALLKSAYPFIVISAAALAAFQVDRFIAYTFLSPEETARLDITLKVFLALHGLYMVLVARLWQSVGQPWNTGNPAGSRHAMLQAVKTGLLFWIAAGALLVPTIDLVVRAFTRGTLSVNDPAFVIAVACYIGARGIIDTVSVSIFAIRQQHQALRTVIAHGVLNIPLSILGCQMLGLTGIVLGQLASLLITSGWRFPLIFWRATTASA